MTQYFTDTQIYKNIREENEEIDYILRGESVYHRFPVPHLGKVASKTEALLS